MILNYLLILNILNLLVLKILKELSSFENIILITEEGVITKENLNLIDKYLLPYKNKLKVGLFYLNN